MVESDGITGSAVDWRNPLDVGYETSPVPSGGVKSFNIVGTL